jgi:hypothetical protein
MLPADVLATIHPSLEARARELWPEEAEDLLGDAYLRLCRADVEGRLVDRSVQGIKRWMRSALLYIRTERLRRLSRLPDADELMAAGIL